MSSLKVGDLIFINNKTHIFRVTQLNNESIVVYSYLTKREHLVGKWAIVKKATPKEIEQGYRDE